MRRRLVSRLEHYFVVGAPGGIDNTKEHKFLGAGILNPLNRAGGYIDGVAGTDYGGPIINVHAAGSEEDVVDLVGFQAMFDRTSANRHLGQSQRIATGKGVVPMRMEQLPKAGEVAGEDFRTVCDLADEHRIKKAALGGLYVQIT